MKHKFGATGRFPGGKLNAADQGELQFGVAPDKANRLVHVNFGKPVAWFSLTPELARDLAAILVKSADEAAKGTV